MKPLVIFASLVSAIVLLGLFGETNYQTPDIPSKQEPKGSLKPKQTPQNPPTSFQTNQSRPERQDGKEEGTEFWIPFSGYKLKITDSLLIIVTFLLFFATGLLWHATSKLVKGSEDTAKRQLRAYVNITKAQLFRHPTNPNVIAAKIEIKNAGQTPAYNLEHYVGIMSGKEDEAPQGKPPEDIPTSTAILPAQGTFDPVVETNPPLTDDQRQAFDSGVAGIYLVGEIRYRDIFRDPQITKYRGFCPGKGTHNFAWCDDGNEAS